MKLAKYCLYMDFVDKYQLVHYMDHQHDLIALRTEKGVHELLPGLTGWAQVNGRDELPIPQKVELDAHYLKRKSFVFDLKILWMTVIKVTAGQGVSH
jgi:O-antigen biosynthesis protein WbqP